MAKIVEVDRCVQCVYHQVGPVKNICVHPTVIVSSGVPDTIVQPDANSFPAWCPLSNSTEEYIGWYVAELEKNDGLRAELEELRAAGQFFKDLYEKEKRKVEELLADLEEAQGAVEAYDDECGEV